MLRVATRLGKSPIHGIGLFAGQAIDKGALVWSFDMSYDQRFTRSMVELRPAICAEALWHYCYINPLAPYRLVICLDDARHLNFSDPANLALSERTLHGEHDLLAARDIELGEELTVPLESDLDADRKMKSRT